MIKHLNALQESNDLLSHYGFNDWQTEIDTRPTYRYGCCKWDKKKIGLSQFFLYRADASEVSDLILHELAHVLAPGSHHYKVWKQQYARLLWEHQREWSLKRLADDRYCQRHAKKLLRFAQECEGQPILPRLPSPFDQPRQYPWETTRAYIIDFFSIKPIRLVDEDADYYVWMPGNETGYVRKHRKEDQTFFREWEDAKEVLLASQQAQIQRLNDFREQGEDELDERIERAISQLRQLEQMGSPSTV